MIQLATLAPPRGFSAWGVGEGDRVGSSLRPAGDVNGDTHDDLLIGAYALDTVRDVPPDGPTNIVNVGALYLLYGGPALGAAGDIMLAALDGTDGVAFLGREENDFLGLSIAAPGDVNGDSLADFLVSAPYARPHGNYSGQAYLIYGAATHGTAGLFDMRNLDAASGVIFNGTEVQDFAGWSLAGGFDLNHDTHRDIAIGAVTADRSVFSKNVGFTYVVYGGPGFGTPASIELADIIGPNGYQAHGVSAFDESATSLANIGDWNGDGRVDILIGAGAAETAPNVRPGAVYVVFGQP
jgi:glycosylphosphatidylinositol phospholipase D